MCSLGLWLTCQESHLQRSTIVWMLTQGKAGATEEEKVLRGQAFQGKGGSTKAIYCGLHQRGQITRVALQCSYGEEV